MARFKVNGRSVTVDVDDSTPLLRVLRDSLILTEAKYDCGLAQCGATVRGGRSYPAAARAAGGASSSASR